MIYTPVFPTFHGEGLLLCNGKIAFLEASLGMGSSETVYANITAQTSDCPPQIALGIKDKTTTLKWSASILTSKKNPVFSSLRIS